MRDLRGAVRERLAPLRLDPHQEADVVEELTQELEERHARAVREGRSVEEADAVVSGVAAVPSESSPMNDCSGENDGANAGAAAGSPS